MGYKACVTIFADNRKALEGALENSTGSIRLISSVGVPDYVSNKMYVRRHSRDEMGNCLGAFLFAW